jgi:hypothetical protein
MDLKPGAQLASVVCDARVVVVKAPASGQADIGCGGRPMVPAAERGDAAGEPDAALSTGVQLGKRYEADGVELLCTGTGTGTLTCAGEPMVLKAAKPLPASD